MQWRHQISLQVGYESLTDAVKSCFPGENICFLAYYEQIYERDVCVHIYTHNK